MRPTRLLTAALVGWMLVACPGAASADIFVSPFLGLKFRGDSNELQQAATALRGVLGQLPPTRADS